MYALKRLEDQPTNDPLDALLLQRLVADDWQALGDLYDRYHRMVKALILAVTPGLGNEDLEDLCQDVFLTVGIKAPKYREEGKAGAWISGIAVRIARRRRRRFAQRERAFHKFGGGAVGADSERLALSLNRAEARLDMETVLEGLTLSQRQVILLFACLGMEGAEIAELLGMEINTVWSHLSRASRWRLSN